MVGSGLPSESGGEALRDEEGARESTRTRMEAAGSSGEDPPAWVRRTHANETSLKRSAELPIDDPWSEVRGRGLHLDDDVPIVTPTAQQN